MSPLFRFFIRCGVVFFLFFLGAQLFNRFCNLTNKCQPFYFSRYIPRHESGELFGVSFEVTNHRSNLEFDAMESRISTVGNRLNSVIFRARNISDRKVGFQPKLEVTPQIFAKYFEPIHCLCSQSYSLAPREVRDLKMEFFINPKIQDEREFKKMLKNTGENMIKISYKIN